MTVFVERAVGKCLEIDWKADFTTKGSLKLEERMFMYVTAMKKRKGGH